MFKDIECFVEDLENIRLYFNELQDKTKSDLIFNKLQNIKDAILELIEILLSLSN